MREQVPEAPQNGCADPNSGGGGSFRAIPRLERPRSPRIRIRLGPDASWRIFTTCHFHAGRVFHQVRQGHVLMAGRGEARARYHVQSETRRFCGRTAEPPHSRSPPIRARGSFPLERPGGRRVTRAAMFPIYKHRTAAGGEMSSSHVPNVAENKHHIFADVSEQQGLGTGGKNTGQLAGS